MSAVANSPEPHCQCVRFQDHPCKWRITQEDLLCDTCRLGCSLMAFGPHGSAEVPSLEGAEHIRVGEFKFSFDPLPSLRC